MGELDVLGYDIHTLNVDVTQVGFFQKTDKIGLRLITKAPQLAPPQLEITYGGGPFPHCLHHSFLPFGTFTLCHSAAHHATMMYR